MVRRSNPSNAASLLEEARGMSASGELRKLLSRVRATKGWRVAQGKKHIKIYSPEGEMTTTSARPHDQGLKGLRADLRRLGLDLRA